MKVIAHLAALTGLIYLTVTGDDQRATVAFALAIWIYVAWVPSKDKP